MSWHRKAFFKVEKFRKILFCVIDFGLMQKSVTWNSISWNSSDRPVVSGEPYQMALNHEKSIFVTVFIKIGNLKPLTLISKGQREQRLFLRDGPK